MKMKVGRDINDDIRRAGIIREEIGYSENKVKIFMENEKEFNGEYLLDPLAIKEIILSWVTKDPPKPNLVS